MFWIVADTMQEFADVSTHICAGNVSVAWLFCLGCHAVSTHICAGNVSLAGDVPVAVGVVSTHMCAGNVSCGDGTDGWPRKFRFIYTRGMFQASPGYYNRG